MLFHLLCHYCNTKRRMYHHYALRWNIFSTTPPLQILNFLSLQSVYSMFEHKVQFFFCNSATEVHVHELRIINAPVRHRAAGNGLGEWCGGGHIGDVSRQRCVITLASCFILRCVTITQPWCAFLILYSLSFKFGRTHLKHSRFKSKLLFFYLLTVFCLIFLKVKLQK